MNKVTVHIHIQQTRMILKVSNSFGAESISGDNPVWTRKYDHPT
jgi:hypothetical protein